MIVDSGARYGADAAGTVTISTGRGLVVLPSDRQAEIPLLAHWYQTGIGTPAPTSTLIGVSIPVVVNDNRWIVQCPTCGGAQIASKTDRRFFCIDCLNRDHGGQWITVAWPGDISAIETALDARPDPSTRGWLPGQTVADLNAENVQHGLPDTLNPADTTGAVL